MTPASFNGLRHINGMIYQFTTTIYPFDVSLWLLLQQVNLAAAAAERSWKYQDGGMTQTLQADTNTNIAYIESPRVTVLVDYNTVKRLSLQ